MTDACEDKNIPVINDKVYVKDTAAYLWQEYQYRHDLCWKSLFRLTGAVLFLSVIPYLYEKITKVMGIWMLTLPVIAIIITIFGWLLIIPELDLLDKIRNNYRCFQNKIFPFKHNGDSSFNRRVKFYIVLLIILIGVNFVYLYFFWIPNHETLATIPKLNSLYDKHIYKKFDYVVIDETEKWAVPIEMLYEYEKLLRKFKFQDEADRLKAEISSKIEYQWEKSEKIRKKISENTK